MSCGRCPVPALAAERKCAKSTLNDRQFGTQQPCERTHLRCRGQIFWIGSRKPIFGRFRRSGKFMTPSRAREPSSLSPELAARASIFLPAKRSGREDRNALPKPLARLGYIREAAPPTVKRVHIVIASGARGAPNIHRLVHRPTPAKADRRARARRCRAPTRTGRHRGTTCGYDSNPPKAWPDHTVAPGPARSATS